MVCTRGLRARFGVLALMITLLLSVSGTALAAGYFQTVAGGLKHSRLFVDPKALLPLKPAQIVQINQLIGEHPEIPIYLAQIDKRQVGDVPPDQWPAQMHTAVGKPGVYAVLTDQFHAQAFNVAPELADQAGTLASQTIGAHKATRMGLPIVPYDVLKNYVAAIHATQDPPPSTLSNIPDKTLLILIGLCLLCLAAIKIWDIIQSLRTRRQEQPYEDGIGEAGNYRSESDTTETKEPDSASVAGAAAVPMWNIPLGPSPDTPEHPSTPSDSGGHGSGE